MHPAEKRGNFLKVYRKKHRQDQITDSRTDASVNSEKWDDLDYLAVLETDARKMPGRIASAHLAIAQQMQSLAGDNNGTDKRHRNERERIFRGQQ